MAGVTKKIRDQNIHPYIGWMDILDFCREIKNIQI